MTTNQIVTAKRRDTLLALSFLAAAGGLGCAAQTPGGDEGPVASQEAALVSGGGSVGGAGYTCSPNGSCECDKSIENDCEDMSGICRDADIDNLIRCINGWLTTHCTCTKALVRNPGTHFPTAGTANVATAKVAF